MCASSFACMETTLEVCKPDWCWYFIQSLQHNRLTYSDIGAFILFFLIFFLNDSPKGRDYMLDCAGIEKSKLTLSHELKGSWQQQKILVLVIAGCQSCFSESLQKFIGFFFDPFLLIVWEFEL